MLTRMLLGGKKQAVIYIIKNIKMKVQITRAISTILKFQNFCKIKLKFTPNYSPHESPPQLILPIFEPTFVLIHMCIKNG